MKLRKIVESDYDNLPDEDEFASEEGPLLAVMLTAWLNETGVVPRVIGPNDVRYFQGESDVTAHVVRDGAFESHAAIGGPGGRTFMIFTGFTTPDMPNVFPDDPLPWTISYFPGAGDAFNPSWELHQ